jgi:hypothetical protein
MKQPTVSPIKDRPLRLPAQSLSEERQSIWDDKLEPTLLLALFMVVLAAFEWFRHFHAKPPTPVLMTVIAVITVAFAAWKFFRLRPKMKQLRQAIDGEKAVGQFLERLRESGYVVFHDIVGKGFNIDHVLIGPTGVYTIETKTWSKPADRDARITFNGTTLLAGKFEPDRDPITQAKAQSSWLRSVITESTGRKVRVFPVILFPGWYVDQAPASRNELWILEPKALPAFLDNEPMTLSQEDRNLVAFHVSRFIRSAERDAM